MAYSPKRGGRELQRGEQARRGLAPQVPVPLTGSREGRTCNRRAGKEGTGSAGACPPYPLHVAASTITASHRSRGGPLTVTLVINDTRLLTVISPLFGLTGNSYTKRLLTHGACALGIVSATNFGVAVRYKLQICSIADGSPDGRLGPD